MRTHIALDSGAFSMYRKSVLGPAKEKKNPRIKNSIKSVSSKVSFRSRGGDDYYASEAYEDYLEQYAAYVQKHDGKFDYYVTLDAMFDPERTWQATRTLEKHGLKPMPVFHYGEDTKWLKKYMDRFEYIGIGGIARGVGMRRRMTFLRRVFALTHPNGANGHKLHGFGITSAEFMRELPWYSVDSYSPLALANNGKLQMPAVRMIHGKFAGFDYTRAGPIVYMTSRLASRSNCWAATPKIYQDVVAEFLRQIGLTPKDLYDPEATEDRSKLGWALLNRGFANLYSYGKTAEAISALRDDTLRLYFSGSIGGAQADDFLRRGQRYGLQEFRWLGTYFDRKPIEAFLVRECYQGREYNRRPTLRRLG